MQVFEISPHVGIGPLQLGMTAAEVRRAVPAHEVKKIKRGREEMIDSLGLNVDYSEGDAKVNFIQAFPVDDVRFEFRGLDVFSMSADELVAAIVKKERLRKADFAPGQDEYQFPKLHLVLWRSCVEEEPGEQGWAFESVSVHVPGYYD